MDHITTHQQKESTMKNHQQEKFVNITCVAHDVVGNFSSYCHPAVNVDDVSLEMEKMAPLPMFLGGAQVSRAEATWLIAYGKVLIKKLQQSKKHKQKENLKQALRGVYISLLEANGYKTRIMHKRVGFPRDISMDCAPWEAYKH
jgi:hypothetical protein